MLSHFAAALPPRNTAPHKVDLYLWNSDKDEAEVQMERSVTPDDVLKEQCSDNVLARDMRIVAVDADTARYVDEYGQTHPEVMSQMLDDHQKMTCPHKMKHGFCKIPKFYYQWRKENSCGSSPQLIYHLKYNA